VAIIWPSPLDVSSYAAAGRQIAVPGQRCPDCKQPLTGWGGYWRWVRPKDQPEERLWIRRGCCPQCRHTHAFLPSFLFRRRLDPAAVIGEALSQAVVGQGMRTIAQQLALPHTTVRAWWRRLCIRAPTLLGSLLRWATSLDPAPVLVVRDGAAAVLETLTQTWERARARLREHLPDQWAFWSLITGGLALATNTSVPFPARSGGR